MSRPEADVDPPLFVTAPYSLTSADLFRFFTPLPLPFVAAGMALIIGLAAGPVEGVAVFATYLLVLLVLPLLREHQAASTERTLTVWRDGRFRIVTPTATIDRHLGNATVVEPRFGGWRLVVGAPSAIPKAALTPGQRQMFADVLAARRRPGPAITTYAPSAHSTLPFTATFREAFPGVVRSSGPLLLFLVVIVAPLFGVGMGSATGGVIAAIAWAVVGLAALAGRAHRDAADPRNAAQRAEVLPGSFAVHGPLMSVVVVASAIRSVEATRRGLVVSVERSVRLPDRAFRDAEHRDAFERALRAQMA